MGNLCGSPANEKEHIRDMEAEEKAAKEAAERERQAAEVAVQRASLIAVPASNSSAQTQYEGDGPAPLTISVSKNSITEPGSPLSPPSPPRIGISDVKLNFTGTKSEVMQYLANVPLLGQPNALQCQAFR